MDIEKHLIITGTSEVSWKDAIVKQYLRHLKV